MGGQLGESTKHTLFIFLPKPEGEGRDGREGGRREGGGGGEEGGGEGGEKE
jgi:hypothetical protein